jgi:hypothetical protein
MTVTQETKFDTVEFGGLVDSVKLFLSRNLNKGKSERLIRAMEQAVRDQQLAILREAGWNPTGFTLKNAHQWEDQYNSGWLYAFLVGLEVAKMDAHQDMKFFGSYRAYEERFVQAMRKANRNNLMHMSRSFREGAEDAYRYWSMADTGTILK